MSRTQASCHDWSVVAPFFRGAGRDRWIDDFITGERWTFRKVPLPVSDDWHLRQSRATGASRWLDYWDQSRRAFPTSGLITVFPQPALMAAVQKKLLRLEVPLLAWCFNLGEHPHGLKKLAARAAFKAVDRFVVHSSGEILKISDLLNIPPAQVEFVPLQRAPIDADAAEEKKYPFVVAMGSANRDYRTFLKAAEICGVPCKVVAPPRAIEGLHVPANVTVEFGLSPTQCHRLVQQSRFSVVPILDPEIASGQVTVIESMRMNRAVIATDSIGTVDYIRSGETGRLVPVADPESLADAMQQLWDDVALRERVARNAARFAEESLSDHAAARALARIMAELEAERA